MADLRIIPIVALLPGMYVVQITKQNGPVKIRKQGHINSPDMVKGLQEMGVTEVQIDITQSIDIEPDLSADIQSSYTPSQTQALLQQTQARNLDNEMSEQFNRSIFLPSIQRMPSMWERLRGDIVRYTMVASLGLTFGYLGMWAYVSQFAVDTIEQAPVAEHTPKVEQAPSSEEGMSKVGTSSTADGLSIADGSSPNTIQEANNLPNEPSTAVEVASVSEVLIEEQSPTIQPEAEGRLLTNTEEDSTAPSPEIQARLAEALAELDDLPLPEPAPQVKVTSSDDLPRIGQLPASLLTRMPSMIFAQHMYSSEADARWVRVNNRRLQEGDMIEGRVKIEAIEPQHVVLSINGTRFTMAALTDW